MTQWNLRIDGSDICLSRSQTRQFIQFIVKPPEGLPHRDSWSGRFSWFGPQSSLNGKYIARFRSPNSLWTTQFMTCKLVGPCQEVVRWTWSSCGRSGTPSLKGLSVALPQHNQVDSSRESLINIPSLSWHSGTPCAHNIGETFRTRERRKAINLLFYPKKGKHATAQLAASRGSTSRHRSQKYGSSSYYNMEIVDTDTRRRQALRYKAKLRTKQPSWYYRGRKRWHQFNSCQ